MTLSPESRAQALLDALLEAGAIEQLGRTDPLPLIAAAIREAENEALERAAAWLDEQGPLHRMFREQAATAIRSLKSKD